MNEKFRAPIRQVIELLVARKYSELEALTNGVRLNGLAMANAIMDYGRQLVLPPNEAFELMDVVAVRNAHPSRWSVTMPLWTKEEGRSDLSLDVTLIEADKDFKIELDNIHVP